MIKHAKQLFNELLDEAIDCTTIPFFMDYKNMTSNHAERAIIGLLKKGKLYRYEDRLIVRKGDRLCFILLNKKKKMINVDTISPISIQHYAEDTVETVRIVLPFSPKWICGGKFKCRDIRNIKDYFVLNQLVEGILS